MENVSICLSEKLSVTAKRDKQKEHFVYESLHTGLCLNLNIKYNKAQNNTLFDSQKIVK